MLLNFEFANLKSFRDRQKLTLEAVKSYKELSSNLLSTSIIGQENKTWLKGAVLYGHNASGKSSVIDAIDRLRAIVKHSASVTDPAQSIPGINPYAFSSAEEPTVFRVEFALQGIRHEFTLVLTSERILYESLRVYPNANGSAQNWYERKWNAETAEYDWGPKAGKYSVLDKNRTKLTNQNVLYLSRAVSLGDDQLNPIFQWFSSQLVILNLADHALDETFSADWVMQGENKQIMTRLLQSADIGISNIDVNDRQIPEDLLNQFKDGLPEEIAQKLHERAKSKKDIKLEHTGPDGQRAFLHWRHESTGTQRLFSLLGPLIDILQQDKVIIIDELEQSLHPNLVSELLKICYHNNFSQAQLIFTTHNSQLLDEDIFRRDQVWFTMKDQDGASTLYPLTKYAPRNDESQSRGYLAGRYGATPNLQGDYVSLINELMKNQ